MVPVRLMSEGVSSVRCSARRKIGRVRRENHRPSSRTMIAGSSRSKR